jgi:hypothetical protein
LQRPFRKDILAHIVEVEVAKVYSNSELTSCQSRTVLAICLGVILGYISCCSFGQDTKPVSLAEAHILIATSATLQEQTAANVLAEEMNRRTGLHWPIGIVPGSVKTEVVLASAEEWPALATQLRLPMDTDFAALPSAAESFVVSSITRGSRLYLVVRGQDDRGVLFGVGYVLRHLDMSPGAVAVHGTLESLNSVEIPSLPIRGHQLGYRPKNNTFDAWTLKQFEQYIRADPAALGRRINESAVSAAAARNDGRYLRNP